MVGFAFGKTCKTTPQRGEHVVAEAAAEGFPCLCSGHRFGRDEAHGDEMSQTTADRFWMDGSDACHVFKLTNSGSSLADDSEVMESEPVGDGANDGAAAKPVMPDDHGEAFFTAVCFRGHGFS